MPEIKNTFTGGKMNKDLDERLVPPGEYRDALNISVGRSEGSDVGALENLRGNELIEAGDVTVSTTRVITPAVPGEPARDEVVGYDYSVVSYIAPIAGSEPGLQNVDHEFSVISYVPAVPAQSGQPASATQTVRLNERLVSSESSGGSTTGSGDRRGQVFVHIATSPGDSFNVQVVGGNPVPAVGDSIQFDSATGDNISDQDASSLYTVTNVLGPGGNGSIGVVYLITVDRPLDADDVGLQDIRAINVYDGHIGGETVEAVFNYTFTAGSLFDEGGYNFLDAEQIEFTDPDGNMFTIIFDGAATEGEDNSFVTSDTFDLPAGTLLTFDRFYEFAGGVTQYVSNSGLDYTMSDGSQWEVGEFYGYRQPSILGNTTIPHVTAVNGNVITLSEAPAENFDSTRPGTMFVYNLRYVGGGDALGTPAIPATISVQRTNAAHEAPMVGEEVIFGSSEATIDAIAPNNNILFPLQLNEDLTPNPSSGDTVVIRRQEVVPGVDASPGIITIIKTSGSHPNPIVGDSIQFQDSAATATAVATNASAFNVTLNQGLTPSPTSGSTVTIGRTVTIPEVPGIPAVTETTTELVSIVPDEATTIGSIRDNNTDKIYWFITSPFYDGVYEYDQATGDVSTIIRGDLNFSTDNLITGINIIDGMIFWTDNVNEPRKLNIDKWKNAIQTTIPTTIYGRAFTEADITVIKPHPKEGLTFTTTEDVDSDKPPFEEIFPQFAYRWKYDDGEYSPFSFFTEPAFVPGPYDTTEHYKEGYNKAVRNTITDVTVSNIPKGTPDVVEVDILYTESISATVYTLRTIRKNDEEWGTDPQYIRNQNFSKRSFYSAVPGNQLTRPFDNIPRAAKAQEITANRLIYANYLHNFPQPKTADIGVVQRDHSSNSGLSVKGSRDYEVGVVYEDQFGRQGAMITGPQSTYTTRFNARATQQLEARVLSEAPDWATHFKYFVKDASMDHHNFPVYNTFNDGDADNNNSEFVWLQVASDDRNKVSQDTFLVPRRHTHGELASAGVNTQGAGFTMASQTSIETNAFGTSSGNGRDVIFWVSGGSIPDTPKRGGSRGSGLVEGGAVPANISDGIYTAPADGTYSFVFSGEASFASDERFRSKNNARMAYACAFQVKAPGTDTFESNGQFVRSSFDAMRDITDDNASTWSDSFATNMTVDLNEGDQVRPVLLQHYRKRTADSTRLRINLENVVFETLVTPADPDLPAPPVELPGFPFEEFSRHKVIDIENEAPDIVRTQLPVELRKLGNTIEYGTTNKEWFLVQNFGASHSPETPDATGYTASSTELYYQSGYNNQGFLYDSLFPSLNIILDREGLDRLVIYQGIQQQDIDPGDRVITVDVSGVEGGLYLGVGAANTLIETGVAGKVRINEISVGFDSELSQSERSIIRFNLAEPIGINPEGQELAVFKGDITDNALKNLQGTFFVKIPRATGNETLPFIPTGKSLFDDENNIATLQTIWFETLPVLPESNLDLFWEASESIPIEEHGERHLLDFYNCVALVQDDHVFLETQRIFDRFNSVQMVKGVRANVPQEGYDEERRKYGLTWSGIYNSRTGINRLNQFIQADGITKELEPNYGGIQKLHTRDTNIVVFCEDKIFRILADKDLLFNADGGGNVSASNAVLGQTTPFTGEYGISLNPESFATYGSRMYFTDRNRGVVLRLSQDGLTEITTGMSDFFRDLLAETTGPIWGSYDDYSDHFNLTFDDYTVSFSEDAQGWPSRKSFVPESGLTLNNRYYTFKDGFLWVHNSRNVDRNNFYGEQYNSAITTIFNQEPSSIKNFKTINYEGTSGWTAPLILTDQEFGSVTSFQNKEGKWFECIGVGNNEEIVSVIEEVGDLGPIDFFDEDAMNDGDPADPFDDVGYDFNDDYTDGDPDTDDVSDSDMPDDPLGLGDAVDVTDGDGGEPQDEGGDPADPVRTTITFNIE